MTNYPTIYESYRTNNLIEVAFIKWSGTHERTDQRGDKLITMAPYDRMRCIKIVYTKPR